MPRRSVDSFFELQKNEPKWLESLSRGQNCTLREIVNCRAIPRERSLRAPFRGLPPYMGQAPLTEPPG
jgi:hypothetical protein